METARLLQHIACSGGTIMSHAVACLPDVVVLSEVHPGMGMRRRVNPYRQVADAYPGILSDRDFDDAFNEEIGRIGARCSEAGRVLVIRDHTNADFLREDGFEGLRTARVLAHAFEVRGLFTVRHPIDCWLGMKALDWMPLSIDEYCRRFRRFAVLADAGGFVRYEDFTESPDTVVREMARVLGLSFDPGWKERMPEVGMHLTGRSGRSSLDIAPRPRRPMDASDLAAFNANGDYRAALEVLGYGHPEGMAA